MSMQRIREVYNVPAKRGMVVNLLGEPHVILSASRDALHLILRPVEGGPRYPAHPTWQIDYPPFATSSDAEPCCDGRLGDSCRCECHVGPKPQVACREEES